MSGRSSNEPIFSSLFGAGGMLAALIGPALVFITGIAVPFAWMNPDTMSYAHMLACPQNRAGKGFAFAVNGSFRRRPPGRRSAGDAGPTGVRHSRRPLPPSVKG